MKRQKLNPNLLKKHNFSKFDICWRFYLHFWFQFFCTLVDSVWPDGEISPLWKQKLSLWQFLEGFYSLAILIGSFSLRQNLKPTLANSECPIWQFFIVVNSQALEKWSRHLVTMLDVVVVISLTSATIITRYCMIRWRTGNTAARTTPNLYLLLERFNSLSTKGTKRGLLYHSKYQIFDEGQGTLLQGLRLIYISC